MPRVQRGKVSATFEAREAAGCGSLRLLRALDGTRILQAAAPTAPPCFGHWPRSSPLQTKGCSPLVTPKLLGSIQKIQAAPLKDFLCSADFEFLSSSSIWCHPVISSDIWFPLCKGKIHASTNNNLKYPRFFDAFSLYSVFSIWTAQMEIGGMFRRDAEPVIQDCAHRLFSFFGKYFKLVQFRGRLIRIQNVAMKTGCTPRQ